MQSLSIEAASSDSALDLFDALLRFSPRWSRDEEGRHFVSVQLRSEAHVLVVLDTIRTHRGERAGVEEDPVRTVTVSVEDRRYSVHDR